MEEDPFNPDYVEVDRVLEVSYCEDKDTGEVKYIPLLSMSGTRVFYLCLRGRTCFTMPFFFFFFHYIFHSSDAFVCQKGPRPSWRASSQPLLIL